MSDDKRYWNENDKKDKVIEDKTAIPEEESGFTTPQSHLSAFGRYFDKALAQDKKDLDSGKAIKCPYGDGVCDFDYCQSFHQGGRLYEVVGLLG